MTEETIQTNEHHAHSHQSHEHTTKEHHPTPKNPIEALQQKIWENRKIIFLLLVIFLLAISVRTNLVRYDGNYLFEPDAFYHARLVQDLVTKGSVPTIDPLNYYQVLGGVPNQPPTVYHYLVAFIYFLVAFGQTFNKELLSFVVQVTPAIFGAFITIGMYFLSKEIFNNKNIGLVTAFLTAVTPAFAYRTMAGAQGDNSLGFLWMVIGFYFLVKAVKTETLNKKDIINTILAGIFFGVMAATWKLHLLIPIIVFFYFIFGLLLISSKSKVAEFKKSELFYFIIKIFGSMFIYTIIAVFVGENWLINAANQIAGRVKLDPILLIIIAIISVGILIAVSYWFSKSNKESKKIALTLVVLGLFAGLITLAAFFAIVPDLANRTSIGSMVGEESVGNQFFGSKYNALIVFPIAGMILLPVLLYFSRREDAHTQLLLWFWTVITFTMAWYTLKFTFVFGLGIVTGAALVFGFVQEMFHRTNMEKQLEQKFTFIALAFLLLLGVGAVALFIPDYAPFPNQDSRLIPLMNWIDENTPTDAKFFNWWNDGHVLTYVTERRFSADNRNEGNSNLLLSQFATTTDTNKAYDIAKNQIGADYIYLQDDMVYSLPTFEYYVANKVDSRLGQKYSVGTIYVTGCSDAGTNVRCGNNNIPKTELAKISTTWKSTPDAFPDGTNPIYYYYNNGSLIVLNQAANNTNIAKVLLESSDTSGYYELVYVNSGLKIFKIKK